MGKGCVPILELFIVCDEVPSELVADPERPVPIAVVLLGRDEYESMPVPVCPKTESDRQAVKRIKHFKEDIMGEKQSD